MRVFVSLVAVLAVVAQVGVARGQDAGPALVPAGGVASDGEATAGAGGRKLLYTAPEVVSTTEPAGVDCAWGSWSAWSTCYQNAYSKDEPLRCNLGVSRRTRAKTTFQTLTGQGVLTFVHFWTLFKGLHCAWFSGILQISTARTAQVELRSGRV
jgi:hypothetical protein